jgi:hypothetical protein
MRVERRVLCACLSLIARRNLLSSTIMAKGKKSGEAKAVTSGKRAKKVLRDNVRVRPTRRVGCHRGQAAYRSTSCRRGHAMGPLDRDTPSLLQGLRRTATDIRHLGMVSTPVGLPTLHLGLCSPCGFARRYWTSRHVAGPSRLPRSGLPTLSVIAAKRLRRSSSWICASLMTMSATSAHVKRCKNPLKCSEPRNALHSTPR